MKKLSRCRNFLASTLIAGSILSGFASERSFAQKQEKSIEEGLNEEFEYKGSFLEQGKDAYLKAQSDYFEDKIAPLLHNYYNPIQAEAIKNSIRNGNYLISNTPWFGCGGTAEIGGNVLDKGVRLYESSCDIVFPKLKKVERDPLTSKIMYVFDEADTLNSRIFSIYPTENDDVLNRNPTASFVINARNIDLGHSDVVVNGTALNNIELAGALIHEHQHLINKRMSITNLIEDEFIAHRLEAQFYQSLGISEMDSYKRSALFGIKAFYEEADKFYKWKDNGIALTDSLIEKYK